jgi:hypothetical protein
MCAKVNRFLLAAALKAPGPHPRRLSGLLRNRGIHQIMPKEQTTSTYAPWFGRSVALRVVAGEMRTTLCCIVVGESEAAVRVRVGGIWDVDIYKEMVFLVEGIVPFYEEPTIG